MFKIIPKWLRTSGLKANLWKNSRGRAFGPPFTLGLFHTFQNAIASPKISPTACHGLRCKSSGCRESCITRYFQVSYKVENWFQRKEYMRSVIPRGRLYQGQIWVDLLNLFYNYFQILLSRLWIPYYLSAFIYQTNRIELVLTKLKIRHSFIHLQKIIDFYNFGILLNGGLQVMVSFQMSITGSSKNYCTE